MAKRKKGETLQELLARTKKQYGAKALAIASDVEELYVVKHLPTGIPQLDMILGGGLPRGHITECFGPWSGGKTYLTMVAIAETQRLGGLAAVIDTEASFAPAFAKAVGVDFTKLILGTPESGEEALDLVLELARRGDVDLLILDSATGLTPKNIIEADIDVSGFSPGVKLWNAGLMRLKPALFGNKTAFVFTNQVRDNVGVMYGPSTTEPMGWRSKHDAVLRLEVRRKEWIKQGDQKVGQVSVIRVNKSKVDGVIPQSETTVDVPFAELARRVRPDA